ncbi:DUF6843 domain-containing protein [Spirosoma flavum]|uniref:DUF6843 domain-containing protein n=1 Tax=Spirosoma flavum TaxID=2048557 RepID=A0ABW6ALD3_9BACT
MLTTKILNYKTGLILTIVSWFFCLNPYWLIFAGPFFVGGLLVVWFSKERLKTKIITAILPLILWYPGIAAFFFLASKHMTPETFLIPRNFRGQITLIYNEPCGQVVPKVDGRLTYKIPANGIMILKNEFETGVIDHRYYFVDKSWNNVGVIPQLIQQDFNEDYTLEKNNNEPPRSKIGLFHLGSGSGSTENNDNYKFHMMVVNCWDSLRVQHDVGLSDKFIDSLLYKCRNKTHH